MGIGEFDYSFKPKGSVWSPPPREPIPTIEEQKIARAEKRKHRKLQIELKAAQKAAKNNG